MNAEKKDRVENDGVWKAVHQAFNHEVPEPMERSFQETLHAFRRDVREHPYIRGQGRHELSLMRKLLSLPRHWFRPFLLACTGVAIVVIAGLFLMGSNPPTWAQVAESFRRADSYYATFYMKSGHWLAPSRVELWAGGGHRFRMLSGHTVAFGIKDAFLESYNIRERTAAEPDPDMQMVLRDVYEVAQTEAGFIEAFFTAHSDGNVVDTTALICPDPIFSKDLVVFDAKTPEGGVSIRMWALRESRLPVRILCIFRGFAGYYVDVVFSYSKAQPEKFFDPDAFAAEMNKSHHMDYDLMYLFMEDPAENRS